MNNLQIFNNPEFGEIRTIQKDGEPWFVGKDVAAALGYKDTVSALKSKIDDEDKAGWQITTQFGTKETTIINESGLYCLIFSSKLEKAKQFKRWVTTEVLPSIRKTGGYATCFQSAPLQAESASGVAQLIKALRATMKDNEQPPEAISQMVMMLCMQFGIRLPENFVKVNPFEQLALQADSTT